MSSSESSLIEARKFNLFSRQDPIQAFYGVKPLESNEANHIEKLLVDNFQPGLIKEEEVIEDAENLKNLTSEIKAIKKQGAILIGERIQKARDILKKYHNRTFLQWIDMIFGSRRTAYNMLSYYELYNALPIEVKENFKNIPQKAAYTLASKKGPIEIKTEIVANYQNLRQDDLISLINEKLPKKEKKIDKVKFHFGEFSRYLKYVERRKDKLTNKDVESLLDLKKLIDEILIPLNT